MDPYAVLSVAATIQALAAAIIFGKTKTILNPLFAVPGGFALITTLVTLNPLLPDPVGVVRLGTGAFLVSEQTAFYLLIFSVAVFVISLTIKSGRLGTFNYQVDLKFESVVIVVIVLTCLIELMVGVIRGGGIPLLVMSRSGAGGYGEYRIGFLTVVTQGSAKFLFLFLVMKYLTARLSLRGFLQKHRFLILAVAACLLMNALGGLRNLVLVPSVLVLYVLIERIKVTWLSKALLVGVSTSVGLVIFVIVGNFRDASGKFLGDILRASSGIPAIDSLLSWIYLYAVPNVLNLNSILDHTNITQNGAYLLTLVVPDQFLLLAGIEPGNSAIYFLRGQLLLPYTASTFVTALGDLYADLGWTGSLVVGALFFLVPVAFYNLRHFRPIFLFLFLNSFKGLYFFALKFSFLTPYEFLPVVLFLLLVRIRRRPPIARMAESRKPSRGALT